MYGTIARMKTRPGALAVMKEMEMRRPSGFVTSYIYQMDADPDELWMVVIFESKQAYLANASSPTQDKEFRAMRDQLLTDPEWHDGMVVYSSSAGS
jgi:heme-degrading monooxygenase HmoA